LRLSIARRITFCPHLNYGEILGMTLPEIFNYLWTEAEVIWFIGIVIAFFVIKQILNLLFPKKSK
tara:strand:+ start:216 stop:410 length:195 start_codon:yes stop_codon:yes gene_type:complete